MKDTSDYAHPPAEIGQNVTDPSPDVHKAKGTFHNKIVVVLIKNENELNKLGTKDIIIIRLYSSSEFHFSKQYLLSIEDVLNNKVISSRTLAVLCSKGSSQDT